ncbi:MAG: ABC transporter ATP-binding protein [Pseudomonadota bacterium]
MIEVNHLSRRYGEFLAVDDVTFTIQPGEVVGLLGHNGAGKTTIMKMLTGFLEPTAGTILVNGTNVAEQPEVVQAQVGYLPENLPVYPEMTVAEYLSYAATLRGCDPETCVPWAIDQTQLRDKATDTIDTLSRGYKQRVGVAQAILHRPSFLILDEPSNGLDPNQIQQMRNLIRNLAQNATIILSTHIMQEVSAVCDRTLILSSGRLALDEQMDDLQQASQIQLRSAQALEIEPLAEIAGVRGIEEVDTGEWLINVEGDLDRVCAAMAQAIIEQDQPIYALSPQMRDLERVFAEVNRPVEASHAV